MFIYIVILLLLCILTVHYDLNQKATCTTRQKKRWQYLVVILLILLAGLRNHVGGDTINYERFFIYDCPKLDGLLSSSYWRFGISQPLWFLINVVLKTMVNDFVILQLFHAILFNCLFYRFIRCTTTKVFTAYTVMYCILWWNFNFEILRESLCVVLFLNGLLCLKDKKVWKYLLWCLPALGIHYFAFVIPFLSLLFYYFEKRIAFITALLGVLVFLSISVNEMSQFLFSMSIFSGDTDEQQMESYIFGDMYGTRSLNIFGILFFMITMALPVIVAMKQKGNSILTRLLWLFIVIFIIQTRYPIVSRFANYLWPILIIEAINYLYTVKLKQVYGLVVFSLLAYNVVRFSLDFYRPSFASSSSLNYDYRYIPYTSVFQDPDPVREVYYNYSR